MNNKKQPMKPKISSIEISFQEKFNDFHENLHQTPSWKSPPSWNISKNKKSWYILEGWATFRRLGFVEILSTSQIIGGFVKVDFFKKIRFFEFSPPSWIANSQTQPLFMDTSRTNKTQKRFLKSVQNWPFGSKNKIFSVLGAILDFAAILEFGDEVSKI